MRTEPEIALTVVENLTNDIVRQTFRLAVAREPAIAQALKADMPLFIASMMGVITGIFGGVLRDIVCNQVPMVLRDGKPYALCAFAGCWMYILMQQVGIDPNFSLWSSALVIVILRLLTWAHGIRLR